MKYYLDTIEQVKAETGVNEYGKREKYNDIDSAEVSFYNKCANVRNDIGEGKNHYYMDIRIVDTTGGVLKKDKIGTMVKE
jgi:hypothetical protein